MKRLLIAFTVLVVLGGGIFLVATHPGTIAAPGVNDRYVAVLEAAAQRTGQRVVWVGRGVPVEVDGVRLWALPHAAPVLFDPEDVPRPFDKIRNERTRREVEAALIAQADLARMEGVGSINARVAAGASELSGSEVLRRFREAATSRGGASAVAEVAEPQKDAPQPKECELFDPDCAGCYTDMGTIWGAQWCGFACINCRPK
jgi:hypothetical protein